MALDENIKAFVMYISFLGLKIPIHPMKKAQMALLLGKKSTIMAKFLDFTNVFLKKLANIFSKQTSIQLSSKKANNHLMS